MKRTIKFRAKAIHNGEWVYGLPIHYNRDYRYEKWTMYDESGLGIDIDEETLCQFTGLHDMHGREIYDGDIIKIKEPNGTYSEAEISFCSKGYWSINHGINERVIAGFVDKRQIEIIGNIYDKNKE